MRKLTYGGASSLDLMIAGPDEAMDWMLWSDDAAAIGGASWQGVDMSRCRAAQALARAFILPAEHAMGTR